MILFSLYIGLNIANDTVIMVYFILQISALDYTCQQVALLLVSCNVATFFVVKALKTMRAFAF